MLSGPMTKDEQADKLGRAVIERKKAERELACLERKIKRWRHEFKTAVDVIDGKSPGIVALPSDMREDPTFDELPTSQQLINGLNERDQLKKKISDANDFLNRAS